MRNLQTPWPVTAAAEFWLDADPMPAATGSHCRTVTVGSQRSQKMLGVGPMFGYCWASVEKTGPTLTQHWANVSRSQRYRSFIPVTATRWGNESIPREGPDGEKKRHKNNNGKTEIEQLGIRHNL